MTATAFGDVARGERVPAAYEFDILLPTDAINRNGLVEGSVRNSGDVAWGEDHLVGLRDFRDVAGNQIPNFELRACMGRKTTAPGGLTHFYVDLSSTRLPANAATCTLDVVEEHVCWLSERGGSPITLHLANASTLGAWLDALHEAARAAPPMLERKLQLVRKVLRFADLRANPNFVAIREMMEAELTGRPYRKPRASSAVVASSLQRAGKDAGELFLRHFATIVGERIDVEDPEDSARLFARFVRDSGDVFRGAVVPLPQKLCAWLNRRALPAAIASTPATRAMVALMRPHEEFDLNPEDDGAEAKFRFVSAIATGKSITDTLLPQSLIASSIRSTSGSVEDIIPPISGFAARLHSGTITKRPSYDLDHEWGRLAFLIDLAILALENEAKRALLGPDVIRWLTEPVADEIGLSILEIALLAFSDRVVPEMGGNAAGGDVALLRRYIDWIPSGETATTLPTIRLVGDVKSPTGLSANLRMSKAAFETVGATVEMIDVNEDLFYPASGPSSITPRRPIDLFHLNLEAVPALVARYAERPRHDTYRIAFALWETSVMPEQHRVGLEIVDEIWAPTEYVAEIYRAAGHPNVQVVGKGIDLPTAVKFDLTRFGIPTGTTTFLLSFDMGSWADRKNPIAAVRAFQRAFPSETDVRLIIKTNGLYRHPGDRTNQAGRIEAAADNDARIVILSELLPFPDYLGLIAAVDATVSSHRSEGFGYLPAYSLLLGTAVIVTDHSGTQDFCTQETSFPVPAELIPVRPGDFVFDAFDARWADIDIDAFASAMRQVRDDPAEAQRRTDAGKALVADKYSMGALGKRYASRLNAV